MHCKIWDNNKIWYSNIESECTKCLNNTKTDVEQINCPLTKLLCRVGNSIAHNKHIFICCTTSECKNKKRFIEKFSIVKAEIPFLLNFMKGIEDKYAYIEREKYSQIVHNLKSLNAQSISTQGLFIPQETNQTYRDLFTIVENKVKEDPREATLTLLKLMKNNNHMKTEFTTHEKLSYENPILFKQNHNIKTVILNVYHSFDMEFRSKNISLNIDDDNIILNFDYDTIRVALYHIFSNALKYMKPYTDLKISYDKGVNYVDIIFGMQSLHILPNERQKIFDDHYSGIQATSLKLNGEGLGLGYIKKAVSLNNGEFLINAGDKYIRTSNTNYSENSFIFRFLR